MCTLPPVVTLQITTGCHGRDFEGVSCDAISGWARDSGVMAIG